jgi:putative ABC transport system permease protein
LPEIRDESTRVIVDSGVTRHYLRLFRWHVWRYIAQHRLLALLNVLSVALGVAVYLAVQIANHSANQAFRASVDVVAGRAEVQLTGTSRGVPEEVFPTVARAPGVAAATPLVRGFVSLPDYPGEYLQLLGIDVFTNEPFRTFEVASFAGSDGAFDVQGWLGAPNTIAVSEEFARQYGLTSGAALRAQVNGVNHQLRVGFVLRMTGAGSADPRLATMDIGWAQELFARRGTLSAIQLTLEENASRAAVQQHLREILPPDVVVSTPAQRNQQVENLLGGFQLNLTAMSLVSLVVGMFLIYNTVSASVVRRRKEIGILRSLGTTRNEVRALFLAEAGALGLLGVAAGIAGGVLLAQVLVGTVARTISTLYVMLSVREISVTPLMFVSATILGLLSVTIAAWLPAAAAAKMDPVRALHGGTILEQAVKLSPGWLWSGIGSIALAGLFSWLALTTGPRLLGFAAALFVLVGFSFLVPSATRSFSRIAARVQLLHPSLAARNLGRALVRNSVTIAALAAAVAMTIGVSVMVFSFRSTVQSWLNQTLAADLFIAPASNELVGTSSFMPPATAEFLEQHPQVEAIDTYRELALPWREQNILVAVVRGTHPNRFPFIRGDAAEILHRFRNEPVVLVSESFARRNNVREGDSLDLPTPAGVRPFQIAGTFYDYTRDAGVVFMNVRTFRELWQEERFHSLAVYLRPGADVAEVEQAYRSTFSRGGEFMLWRNATLRTRIFEIFDQTFAVTYVLRTIAIVVAVVGICLGLTTLIAERSRELAVVRAIGGSAAQLRKLLLWESAMIGLLAAVIGLASGVCLSFVLTGVINRAFFGWTIQLAFPWSALALVPIWITAVAVAAGILPAWRAGKLLVAEALREE